MASLSISGFNAFSLYHIKFYNNLYKCLYVAYNNFKIKTKIKSADAVPLLFSIEVMKMSQH